MTDSQERGRSTSRSRSQRRKRQKEKQSKEEERALTHGRTNLALGGFIDALISITILILAIVFDNPHSQYLVLQIPHVASAPIAFVLSVLDTPFYFRFGLIYYIIQTVFDAIGFVAWTVFTVECIEADTSSCMQWLWLDILLAVFIAALVLLSGWFLFSAWKLKKATQNIVDLKKHKRLS
jgi:hypothetical protein